MVDHIYLNLGCSHGVRLHEVQGVHGSGAQDQWSQVTHGAGYLGRQKDEIILQHMTAQAFEAVKYQLNSNNIIGQSMAGCPSNSRCSHHKA